MQNKRANETNQGPQLTVLSFGGGQDSTALFYMYLHDVNDFRAKYAPNDFAVVMSDTGNEHPETNEHRKQIQAICEDNQIHFAFLEEGDQYHSPSWPSLTKQWEAKNTIGSKCYPKSCTDQLKIRPIYKWLNDYVADQYGVQRTGGVARGKRGIVEFAKAYGKINVMIGIGGDEGNRVGKKETGQKWMDTSIERVYPLIDLDMDRQACQDMITDLGHEVPLPSNCMFCPFLNDVELLWIYKRYPKVYAEWVALEAKKIQANLHMGDKNFGVWGRITLPEKLEEVKSKYSDWTMERLDEYRMSHGHCITNKY